MICLYFDMQDFFSVLDTTSTGTITLYYLKTTQYKYRLIVPCDFMSVLHKKKNCLKIGK